MKIVCHPDLPWYTQIEPDWWATPPSVHWKGERTPIGVSGNLSNMITFIPSSNPVICNSIIYYWKDTKYRPSSTRQGFIFHWKLTNWNILRPHIFAADNVYGRSYEIARLACAEPNSIFIKLIHVEWINSNIALFYLALPVILSQPNVTKYKLGVTRKLDGLSIAATKRSSTATFRPNNSTGAYQIKSCHSCIPWSIRCFTTPYQPTPNHTL